MEVQKIKTFNSVKPLKVPEGTFRAGELKGIIKVSDRCVGCDTCRKVCPAGAMKGEIGIQHEIDLDRCINCGQCLVNCPFGAIEQLSFIDVVKSKLQDKSTKVVAIPAPAVRVALAEEFGSPPGTLTVGRMWTALKKAGFTIYENNFAADQTILEEGTELIGRIAYHKLNLKEVDLYLYNQTITLDLKEFDNMPLPQFTSCCPGWVRFAEIYYPDILNHVSSCRSPMQMAGPTAKTYGALNIWKVNPLNVYTVGIMPCTAKIFEASRPEFNHAGQYLAKNNIIPNGTNIKDIDAVLTTRDLATLFRELGINPLNMEEGGWENPEDFEWYSGGATIFGNSGGVMEAAIRFTFRVLSGQEPNPTSVKWNFEKVRGLVLPIKEATISIPLRQEYQKALKVDHLDVKVCTVNGIGTDGMHLKKILKDVTDGKSNYDFIEVMTCPGGCINGGGQPVNPMGSSWIDPISKAVKV